MIKEGRNFNTAEIIDLQNFNNAIHKKIAANTANCTKEEVVTELYQVLPKYGSGFIKHIRSQEMSIVISRFLLHKDLTFSKCSDKEHIQLSFLLKGEKILMPENQAKGLSYTLDVFTSSDKSRGTRFNNVQVEPTSINKEILLENTESFMAHIKSFNGRIRILGGMLFKEVKIYLSASFLRDHGFETDCDLKRLSDADLVLPIKDELFSILEYLEKTDVNNTINKILLKAKILELIAIQLENYKNSDVAFAKQFNDKALKKIYKIKELIQSNLHKNFSLVDLSKQFGVNYHSCNNEFKRVFGYSVHEYSIEVKMKKAKTSLENTEKLVYQIAEEVGYKNATHFTAAFKRKFKITPIQYRKRSFL